MKKLFALLLACLMIVGLFAGCAGNIVVVGDCTCPTGGHTNNPAPQPTNPKPTDPKPTQPPVEGALKTGLAIVTSVSKSENAKVADYDVTLVAVLVDDNGVIVSCVIDSIPATVSFDNTGVITSDIAAQVLTKNELGENYGMVAYGGAIAEWDSQVAALCNYAVGKTVEELKEKTRFHTDPRIQFVGTVYDQELLMKIRENAYGYFHGHEVGGTNPSLLEALSCTDLNLLLDVGFNREVAEEAALYWTKDSGSLARCIDNADTLTKEEYQDFKTKLSFDGGTPTTIFFKNAEEKTTATRIEGNIKTEKIIEKLKNNGFIS